MIFLESVLGFLAIWGLSDIVAKLIKYFQNKLAREMFPDAYKFFDYFKVYPVDYGFGFIIEGKPGTYMPDEIFAYVFKRIQENDSLMKRYQETENENNFLKGRIKELEAESEIPINNFIFQHDWLISEIFGDREAAKKWLNADNNNFGGTSPALLIKKGKARKVLTFLEAWGC